jgi:hypothetical protein
LKPERWGSLLVQEKYQEEKACDKRHPYRIIIIIIIIKSFDLRGAECLVKLGTSHDEEFSTLYRSSSFVKCGLHIG